MSYVMLMPIGTFARASRSITIVEIEPSPTASVVHRGSYEDMGESYAVVATAIQERGHRIVGPSREVYLNSPAEVAEDRNNSHPSAGRRCVRCQRRVHPNRVARIA